MFCKIGHSVLAQLARIDDDDEYERSPVNNNSQFELARSHTDYDLELEFSFKNFEIRKDGKECNYLPFIHKYPYLVVIMHLKIISFAFLIVFLRVNS